MPKQENTTPVKADPKATTTIMLKKTTKALLDNAGKKGDSYEKIIEELLKKAGLWQ